MIRKIIAVISMLSLLATVDCRHYAANMSNPRVALVVTLLDASNASVTVEDGLSTANDVVEKLQASEPEYYAHVKPLLKKISHLNVIAQQKIVAASNGDPSADWKGAIEAVASGITPADLTSFGFHNQNSQLLVETGLSALILALNQIKAKF